MSVATQEDSKTVIMRKPPADDSDLRKLLWSNKNKLDGLLPEHISVDRFLAQAFRALVEGPPSLMRCSKFSILNSVLKACKFGLELDGIIGEAYLVPYKDECELIPGYKGLMKLAHQAQEIKSIIAACVYKADKFKYELGMHVDIRHIPKAESDEELDDSNITHVYAVVELRNGGKVPCVWPASKIIKHRDTYSPAYRFAESGSVNKGGSKRDSIWHKQFAKMALKTVLRDLLGSGTIPLSVDIRSMIEVEKRIEGDSGSDSDVQKDMDRLSSELASKRNLEQKPEATTIDSTATRVEQDDEPEEQTAQQQQPRRTQQPERSQQQPRKPEPDEQPEPEQSKEPGVNPVVQDFQSQIEAIECEEDAAMISMSIKRSKALDEEAKKFLTRTLNSKVATVREQ